jgi:hypothetical protein
MLGQRDMTFVVVSRAPRTVERLETSSKQAVHRLGLVQYQVARSHDPLRQTEPPPRAGAEAQRQGRGEQRQVGDEPPYGTDVAVAE